MHFTAGMIFVSDLPGCNHEDTDWYNYCSMLTCTFERHPGGGLEERKGCSCVAMAVAAVDRLSVDVQGPVSHRQTLASLWYFEADKVRGPLDESRSG